MTVLIAAALVQLAVAASPDEASCGNDRIDRMKHPVCPPCIPGAECQCSELEVAEECDGSKVPSCASLGYLGGTPKCDEQCRVDASGCQVTSAELKSKTIQLAPQVE